MCTVLSIPHLCAPHPCGVQSGVNQVNESAAIFVTGFIFAGCGGACIGKSMILHNVSVKQHSITQSVVTFSHR